MLHGTTGRIEKIHTHNFRSDTLDGERTGRRIREKHDGLVCFRSFHGDNIAPREDPIVVNLLHAELSKPNNFRNLLENMTFDFQPLTFNLRPST